MAVSGAGTSVAAAGPVLVAEDDEGGRLLLRSLLRKLQVANPVVECSDGEEVVRYLERVEAGGADLPVLLLLDVNMPGRSGLDVLRWRAGRPALAGVPAIVLTGSAQEDEVEVAHALGVISYLVKPLRLRALEEVLRSEALPGVLVGGALPPSPPPQPRPGA